ncbi:MAG: hypothetical protein ACI9WC_002409 [Arenicella sp.]|jgi:hypothetical protein
MKVRIHQCGRGSTPLKSPYISTHLTLFMISLLHNWRSPYERGLNESHNGLIRPYLTKKLPFDDVSNDKVEANKTN